MKKNKSISAWSSAADRRFAASDIGRRILALHEEGSGSQRRLSEYILRDPVFVATHGIEDISAATGISPATISRYVKELGIAGFAQFRSNMAEAVHELIVPVSKIGQRLKTPDPSRIAAADSIASAQAHLQAINDVELIETIRIVQRRITAARQVWVMGFGLSAHLAAMLVLGLQPFRDGVHGVVDLGGSEAAAARLVELSTEDLLISITFPRYSADAVALTRYALENGAEVAGLTDSSVSPIAPFCKDLLVAPATHPVLSFSAAPGVAIIEALVSEFILSDPAHLERSTRLAAAMAHYLSIPE